MPRARKLPFLLALFSSFASAEIRLVPNEYPTVQSAIAASVDGDVIRITSPYIAEQGMVIDGRRISIEGAAESSSGVVTIDAQTLGRHITAGAGSNLTLSKLRFINGRGGPSGGGAIRFAGAEVNVADCEFEGNQAANGGAVWLGGGKARISRSRFVSNSATGAAFSFGGAIRHVAGELVASSSRFSGNTAAYHGGAVSHGWGDGDGNGAGPCSFYSCLFTANSSLYGGGFHGYRRGSRVLLHNVTFVNNSASVGSAFVNYYCDIKLVNAIVAGSGSLFQLYYGGSYFGHSSVVSSGSLAGYGNRTLNPMLSGDFSPLPGSPCIDAGSRGFPVSEFAATGEGVRCRSLSVDLLGNHRFANNPAVPDSGCGAATAPVDIGAIESPGTYVETPVIGDINGDYVVDAADLFKLLSAWGAADCESDLGLDGVVGPEDITVLFSVWGPCSP